MGVWLNSNLIRYADIYSSVYQVCIVQNINIYK